MTDNPFSGFHTYLFLEEKRGLDECRRPDNVFAVQSLPNLAIPPILRFLIPYPGDPSAVKPCGGRSYYAKSLQSPSQKPLNVPYTRYIVGAVGTSSYSLLNSSPIFQPKLRHSRQKTVLPTSINKMLRVGYPLKRNPG
jgi:hypothetical protein